MNKYDAVMQKTLNENTWKRTNKKQLAYNKSNVYYIAVECASLSHTYGLYAYIIISEMSVYVGVDVCM